MTGFNRTTVYGRIVPALAILLGLSYAFLDNEGIRRFLLFALAATAALGWLAPAPQRSPEQVAALQGRREQRHALRQQRRAARHDRQAPGQPAGQLPADQAPGQPPAAQGQPGVVLEGIPQDRLPDDPRP